MEIRTLATSGYNLWSEPCVASGIDIYYAVPIDDYDMYADEFGGVHITGDEDKPSISAIPTPIPSVKAEDPDLRPNMKGGYKKPGLRAYPEPTNL